MEENPHLAPMNLEEARTVMSTALGREPADLAVLNARLVNVYTGEVLDRQGVCVKGRWIAYTGEEPESCIGPGTDVIDAEGKTIIPGLIDGHTHLSYLCAPDGCLKYIMKGGTTSLVTETMEPYPVAGVEGALDFLASLRNQPIKVFATVPAMVSNSSRCRVIPEEDIRRLAERAEVIGLGESYWQALIQSPDIYLPALLEIRKDGKPLEGHSAGASGRKLQAYTAMGITSCHEPIQPEEVLERLRLGVHAMLREGGVRKDLETLAGIKDMGVDLRHVILVTDSVSPEELLSRGYLETVVQKAIDCGFSPVNAIQMATLNVAEHFRLDHLIGGIAPGRFADLVIIPDPATITAECVISNGRVIARYGEPSVQPRRHTFSSTSLHSVHLPRRLTARDFAVAAPGTGVTAHVRVLDMVTDLVTTERHLDLRVSGGEIICDPRMDVIKVAAIDRRTVPGKTFTGFLKGFHLTQGAMACSAAWDTSDIIVAGADEADMALAVNRIHELQGGLVICAGGQVREEIALPVFGIMSLEPIETVAAKLQTLTRAARSLGVPFPEPVLSLITLTGAAIPYLRICEEGLVNLKNGLTLGLFPEPSTEREA